MKAIVVILTLFLSCLISTSCNSDDDSTQQANIHGIWHLINLSGGFTGINEEFERDQISWTFNSENNTVNVVKNIAGFGPSSGIFSYRIEMEDEIEVVYINDSFIGSIALSTETLKIDELVSDGFLVTFKK